MTVTQPRSSLPFSPVFSKPPTGPKFHILQTDFSKEFGGLEQQCLYCRLILSWEETYIYKTYRKNVTSLVFYSWIGEVEREIGSEYKHIK